MDIRIGRVSNINASDRTVRVQFPDVDIVSGWLKVIYRPPYIPQTQNTSGGEGEESFAEHSHAITVVEWMPAIGDTVLCIYGDGFNSDGFVLGALR